MDYSPKRIDFQSLQRGDMGQLIHMFPLQSVSVLLPAQELHGMAGWGAALSQALLDWGKHVGNSEKDRYLAGVRPIHSVNTMT